MEVVDAGMRVQKNLMDRIQISHTLSLYWTLRHLHSLVKKAANYMRIHI